MQSYIDLMDSHNIVSHLIALLGKTQNEPSAMSILNNGPKILLLLSRLQRHDSQLRVCQLNSYENKVLTHPALFCCIGSERSGIYPQPWSCCKWDSTSKRLHFSGDPDGEQWSFADCLRIFLAFKHNQPNMGSIGLRLPVLLSVRSDWKNDGTNRFG